MGQSLSGSRKINNWLENPGGLPRGGDIGLEGLLRESIRRQVDKSPGVPKERGVWNSQGRGKDKHFFVYIP